ncbi:hypothetical protein JTE88_02250 [Arcanobacterium phocisimile]|uniref:Uncharacterized protein n=1 Tax=Arcanobacterium phocisimile TaxID=1302235 RepID=A0ABX7IID9_9ACTO|nr:hypothetical protein [Arcanobacterium phocisimile]QRV02592.1 hypothetical protein JTE88_02250 [Arcanobacterium phocisimile]
MNRVTRFSIPFVVSVLLFTACSSATHAEYQENTSDNITVFDADGQKIATFTARKDLEFFSTLLANIVASDADEDAFAGLTREVPEGARTKYTYEITHLRADRKETTVKFFVYENYPYITSTGIPLLEPLTWEPSKEELAVLRDPLAHRSQ